MNIHDYVDGGGIEGQNPLYPQNRYMTEVEMEALMRERTNHRAISPGRRICKLDLETIEKENPAPHLQFHSTQEYYDYRYDNVIAPGAPWTPWWLYDQWAEIAPARPLPPGPPPGWYERVGIPQMDAESGSLLGYTFVTRTPPTVSDFINGGHATRLRLVGHFQTIEAYVSRCFELNSFVSREPLHRVTAGGLSTFTVAGEIITDSLPYGIDGSGGFLFTAFISAAPGTVGLSSESGWAAKLKSPGNFTQEMDKSAWPDATYPVFALKAIEGYYSATP